MTAKLSVCALVLLVSGCGKSTPGGTAGFGGGAAG
jgi:hypothetical protein